MDSNLQKILQLSVGVLILILGLTVVIDHEQAFFTYFASMEYTYQEQHEWAFHRDQSMVELQIVNLQSMSGREVVLLLEGYGLTDSYEMEVDFKGDTYGMHQIQGIASLIDEGHLYKVEVNSVNGRDLIFITSNES